MEFLQKPSGNLGQLHLEFEVLYKLDHFAKGKKKKVFNLFQSINILNNYVQLKQIKTAVAFGFKNTSQCVVFIK